MSKKKTREQKKKADLKREQSAYVTSPTQNVYSITSTKTLVPSKITPTVSQVQEPTISFSHDLKKKSWNLRNINYNYYPYLSSLTK